jgi:heterodisulfide reductase subunit A
MSAGRIAVFVCPWGSGKDPVLNMEDLRSYGAGLDGVSMAISVPRICLAEGRERMVAALKRAGADRFVAVACSRRPMEAWYRSVARSAGLHPLAFEVANVRERAAMVHEPPAGQDSARRVILMAVAKARLWSPPPFEEAAPVSREVAVVGDGLMASLAAMDLSAKGITVHFISSTEVVREPPGYLFASEEGRRLAHSTVRVASEHTRIRFHASSRVVQCEGTAGDLGLIIAAENGTVPLRCGAVVLAPEPRAELRSMDGSPAPEPARLAAVGARRVAILPSSASTGTGCSCITPRGTLYALQAITGDPSAEVLLLGREIRAMGGFEEVQRQAQAKGVRFVRVEGEPSVEGEGPFRVRYRDALSGEGTFAADLVLQDVVLTDQAMEAARVLRLPIDERGELLGIESRLRPGETVRRGIFACRYRVGDMLFEDMALEAGAAAARACETVEQERLEMGGQVAEVDQESCSACLGCVRICPYGAPRIGASGKAEIRIELCQGCGACVGLCPSRAIDLHLCASAQLLAQARAALGREGG